MQFAVAKGRVVGGEVCIVEMPDRCTTTGDEGEWRFDDLPGDAVVTFELRHPEVVPIQTATFQLAGVDLERVTFQVPDHGLYNGLAAVVGVEPDPERCQIATTATRIGNSLYDTVPGTHGEPGVTVGIAPAEGEIDGPVYFNLVKYNVIFPDRALAETTDDGGVLFLNVPPGDYVLHGTKAGATFTEPWLKCRAGMLVNASPPWGLQVLEGGVGTRTEPNFQ